ncbi:SAM-dependent methyltransferase [Vampirovibrio chlorellavorus]|uniref:SAM-dependent methyltransferase n=1 Tax=Vampirovibrio chlorellavorus TaxID=758823 RepID=UPI0026E9A21C|nr:SAM-dependent methyltransferase [Vampirovibrio chlorellavorus]
MHEFQPKDSQLSVEENLETLLQSTSHGQELLAHLQTALPSPLDLLLKPGLGSLLGHVTTQQALPEEEAVFKPARTILGQECRLSESLLWDMQEQFYREAGISAWEQNVPLFITNSAYIAESYAEMVLAFVEDYFEHLDLSEPLTIIELGTGTGRFSHHMLKELESKLASFTKYQSVRIRYVMTDFTDSNPTFWEQHERLRPFVDKGMLDFAVFNPLANDSVTLRMSGEMLAPGSLKNPVIAIANYFFDTIKQDVFRIESKVLKEGLVTLERNLEGVDPESSPQLSEITPVYNYKDLRSDQYYDDARLNAILKHYRHTVRNGSILFPIGAFQVIKNLEALSDKGLMVISSDKAYTSVEEMTRFYRHDYARHEGAFSYMVNYDAIGQYFLNQDGHYFHTEGSSLSVHTVCCLKLNTPAQKFEHLDYLYRHKLNRANTINSVCAAMPGREEYGSAAYIQQLLSHIRLNLCDPRVFLAMGQQLVDALPQALHSQVADLKQLMEQTWQNYYFYPGEVNIPFWFSQIYYGMGEYDKSNKALDDAIHYYGQHEALYYLKGQNYEQLQQWHKARAAYECALVMKPDFPEATAALKQVEARLKDKP